MMVAINPIAVFIDKHKEVKIVALSFLLLVGFILVAEAMGTAIPKGYLYFALGFASMIQALVLWSQSSEEQLQALADREESKEAKD
jgi:predicted tellurium resistance membrane protein TerC